MFDKYINKKKSGTQENSFQIMTQVLSTYWVI